MYDYHFPDSAFTAWVLVSQTWSAMYRVAERQLARVGLTPEKTEVLRICTEYPSPLTPAEISRLVFRQSQTVAGLLDRMEKEGLVTRVPKRKGRPFAEVKITPKGEELIGPAKEKAMTFIAKLMSSLSAEELEELQRLLRKIRQTALDELYIELSPAPGSTASDASGMKQ